MAITANLTKAVRFIPSMVGDHQRKSLPKIFSELLFLMFYHREFPALYFSRRLYLKDKKDITNYLPNKLLYSIADRINDQSAAVVLSNKLYFDFYYRPIVKHLPKILCHNHGKMFIRGHKEYMVADTDQFEELLRDLILNRSETHSVFIKKMYESHGGKNTYRISEEDLPLNRKKLRELYSVVTSSAYLFQETITQHPKLDEINPSCINSIRMDTFVDKDGSCEVLSAYIRMSTSNSHVDNVSSGGCYVGIDIHTGELTRYGYSAISVTGGNTYTRHPETGIVFKGFKIPFFKEAKAFVRGIARLVPSLRLIGWDIAITPRGPLLIEGNSGYDITGNDMIYGGYRANPVFRKVLSELNETRYL